MDSFSAINDRRSEPARGHICLCSSLWSLPEVPQMFWQNTLKANKYTILDIVLLTKTTKIKRGIWKLANLIKKTGIKKEGNCLRLQKKNVIKLFYGKQHGHDVTKLRWANISKYKSSQTTGGIYKKQTSFFKSLFASYYSDFAEFPWA